ncbi:hypothetical protein QOZ80_1AG0023780 [Eleusine coracana subsp. coracana]|nr:hypothetical protein QOZ80_1AG0023780 [Eleusine coracana subsp. coracana]
MVDGGGSINDDLHAQGLQDDDVDDQVAAAEALFGNAAGAVPAGTGTGSASSPVNVDASPSSSTAVGGCQRRSRSRAPTSKVWKDMEELTVFKNGRRLRCGARCNFCKSTLFASSGGGTGHLIRHVASCKRKALAASSSSQSQLHLNPDGVVAHFQYNADVARSELVRFIARLDLPLNLANCICLTSDIWSGNAKEDYLSVVFHFVTSDWELEKRIVGMRLIDCSHNGVNIADRILQVVSEYGMLDKVLSITLDNASANSSAVTELAPRLTAYIGANHVSDPTAPDAAVIASGLFHLRCACHIINLIVKSGLKLDDDELKLPSVSVVFAPLFCVSWFPLPFRLSESPGLLVSSFLFRV